jgi:hypothetical protein
MRCVIVASGPSAKDFVPPSDVAVNGAIDWLSRADYWFTLDPSAANLERMRRQREGVSYCAAVDVDAVLPSGVSRYVRVARQGREPLRNTAEWWLWRWSSVLGLSHFSDQIHTGNSAYGALGLAYHLGVERVALVGVDASAGERVEGGVPNNLSHLPLLFESALGQIEFINCGDMVSNVPSMSIDRGMSWLMSAQVV